MEYKNQLQMLRTELYRVKERFEALGLKLIEEGKRVKEPGFPPDPALLQEAQQASAELHVLTEKLLELARQLLPSHSPNGYNSLQGLQQLQRKLEESLEERVCGEEESLARARALVERSFAISFPPEAGREREGFFSKLQGYLDLLSGDPGGEEARELTRRMAEGTHPLHLLWQFAEERELEVQKAADLFQEVANEFGLPLALAAVRGDLIFPGREEEALPEAPREKSAPAIAPAEEGYDDLEGLRGEEEGDFSGEQVQEPEPDPGAEKEPPPFWQPPPEAAELDRGTLELFICQMLEQGKLEPAFWLCSMAEQREGDIFMPSLLVQALDLAGMVKGDGGPASQWLSHIYNHLDYVSLAGEQPAGEQKSGMALLLLASLLRPALVAPGTGALQLLSRLCLENQAPLKDYCGFLEEAWNKREPGEKKYSEKDLHALAREAQGWEKRNRGLSLASPRAARLWQRLKEEEGLLHRLIKPVSYNDAEALEDVAQLVNYLRQGENLKMEIAALYRQEQEVESEEIFHIPGSWQVLVRLEEALRLAERWLKLHRKLAKETAPAAGFDSKKLPGVLRTYIEDLKELAGQEWDHTFARSAAVLCQRIFERLEKELQEGALPGEERLTADELADREAKEKAILRFQPGWKPGERTIERMGRALLELLQEEMMCPARKEENREWLVREELGPYAATQQEELFAFEGEDPLEEGILSPQEKDFIREVLRDMGEDLLDSTDEDGEEIE